MIFWMGDQNGRNRQKNPELMNYFLLEVPKPLREVSEELDPVNVCSASSLNAPRIFLEYISSER